MATAIVRNHAEAVLLEEQHLAVPRVSVERPSVRKRHNRAGAPVLVVDRRTVFRGNRAHVQSPDVCGGGELLRSRRRSAASLFLPDSRDPKYRARTEETSVPSAEIAAKTLIAG